MDPKLKSTVLATAVVASITATAIWRNRNYSEPVQKTTITQDISESERKSNQLNDQLQHLRLNGFLFGIFSLTCAGATTVLLNSKVEKNKIDYAAMSFAQATSALILLQNGNVSFNPFLSTVCYSCAIGMGSMALLNLKNGIAMARKERLAIGALHQYLSGGHSTGESIKKN